MKRKYYVTLISTRNFEKYYMGVKRNFVELNCMQHLGVDGTGELTGLKILTTESKLKKALDYRGLKGITSGEKYIIWKADYKGDGNLKFSGIQKWE